MPPQRKLEWHASEYEHTEKGSDWFWAVGIIAVSLTVTAILFNNVLFAIVIVIGAFSLMMFAKRKPLTLTIQITDREVRIGNQTYAYASLGSFWVVEHKDTAHLLLKPKKMSSPLVVVAIKEIPPTIVREFIHQYVDEEELTEPLSQKIMEYLGF